MFGTAPCRAVQFLESLSLKQEEDMKLFIVLLLAPFSLLDGGVYAQSLLVPFATTASGTSHQRRNESIVGGKRKDSSLFTCRNQSGIGESFHPGGVPPNRE